MGAIRVGAGTAGTAELAVGSLARLERSRAASAVAMVALCLAAYLPGFFTMPVIDLDEPRYAQAARQMLEAGPPWENPRAWIVPMVQDRPRVNKPPLIYWLQAASAALLTGGDVSGDAIWMYRVPSLVGAVASVLLTWRLGVRMFGPRAGLVSGALLAVCPLVAWEAHRGRTDMVLLACVLGAMTALWRIWRPRATLDNAVIAESGGRAGFAWPLAFWLAVIAGVLVKGPIILLVAGSTAATLALLARRWTLVPSLRPVSGGALTLGCVGAWAVLVAGDVGLGAFSGWIDETVGRSVRPMDGNGRPPGYHLLLMLPWFWPGSLVVGLGTLAAVRGGVRWPRNPAVLYCLAWLIPSWIAFELVTTKLPHYVLPLYPPLALLAGGAVASRSHELAAAAQRPGGRAWAWAWLAAGFVVGCAGPLIITSGAIVETPHDLVPAVAGGLCVGIAGCLLAASAGALHRARVGRALAGGGAAVLTVVWLLVGVVMPCGESLWPSDRLVEALRRHDPGGRRPLACVGYDEHSVVYVSRGRIRRLGADGVGAWAASNPDGLLAAEVAAWPPPGEHIPRGWRPIGTVAGYNYAEGRLAVLRLYAREPYDRTAAAADPVRAPGHRQGLPALLDVHLPRGAGEARPGRGSQAD